MSKNNRNLVLGVVLAAAAGYVAGVLTAPKSGKETRQDIKKVAYDTKEQLEAKLKSLNADVAKLLSEANAKLKTLSGSAKAELKEAIENAKEAKDKAKEVLSALHEGEADDADLDYAVKDLKASIGHLKTYAKKPASKY